MRHALQLGVGRWSNAQCAGNVDAVAGVDLNARQLTVELNASQFVTRDGVCCDTRLLRITRCVGKRRIHFEDHCQAGRWIGIKLGQWRASHSMIDLQHGTDRRKRLDTLSAPLR